MATFADLNLLDCDGCRMEFLADAPGVEHPMSCWYCKRHIAVYLFPALARPAHTALSAATPVVGAESSCYYHPNKRASVACESCGRFLCELCDVELEGRHRCSKCLESDASSEKVAQAGKRYIYYDSIALRLAIVGLVLYIFSVVLAPVSIYYVIRYWNAPRSVGPRGRWRFVLAAALSGVELLGIAGYAAMVARLFTARN